MLLLIISEQGATKEVGLQLEMELKGRLGG